MYLLQNTPTNIKPNTKVSHSCIAVYSIVQGGLLEIYRMTYFNPYSPLPLCGSKIAKNVKYKICRISRGESNGKLVIDLELDFEGQLGAQSKFSEWDSH